MLVIHVIINKNFVEIRIQMGNNTYQLEGVTLSYGSAMFAGHKTKWAEKLRQHFYNVPQFPYCCCQIIVLMLLRMQ